MKNPSAAKNAVMSIVLFIIPVLRWISMRLKSAPKQTAPRNPHPAFLSLYAGMSAINPTTINASRKSNPRINLIPESSKMVSVVPRRTISRMISIRKKLILCFPMVYRGWRNI